MIGQDHLSVDLVASEGSRRAALLAEARRGLSGADKYLPPVRFYDTRGTTLDERTACPLSLYRAGAERTLLADHASDIVALAAADAFVWVESDTPESTRPLLDAMAGRARLGQIILFGAGEEGLRETAGALLRDYEVNVHVVVGDYRQHLPAIPRLGQRRLWVLLGGTLGELTSRQRARFLFDVNTTMSPGDLVLLGADLMRNPAGYVPADDDLAWATAAFNNSALQFFNRELGADFDPKAFEHVTIWSLGAARVQTYLVAAEPQSVRVRALGLTVQLNARERILTQASTRFTREQITAELAQAGLVEPLSFRDRDGIRELTLCRPYC